MLVLTFGIGFLPSPLHVFLVIDFSCLKKLFGPSGNDNSCLFLISSILELTSFLVVFTFLMLFTPFILDLLIQVRT